MLAGTRKTPRLFYAFLITKGRFGPAFYYVPGAGGGGDLQTDSLNYGFNK